MSSGPTLSYSNLPKERFIISGSPVVKPSTEELVYHGSNIFHRFKRKPWRSSYLTFTVSQYCNKINFNIDGGAEKTATLTSGMYRPAELASHIADVMNTAATTTDIICSYSTGTWTIARGTGTSLQLLTATGTNKQFSIYPSLYMDCRTDQTTGLTHSSFVTGVATTTGGQFIIGATNNKLYFNIGGGGLTATISSTTYSATALCAEIKYQMDAAAGGGVTDFQCAYNCSTRKFILYKGAGTFNLTCTTTTNAVWDTIGFSTSADRTGALSYTANYSRIHSEESIEINMVAATSMDFFSIAGINLAAAATGGTYNLKLQANATDSWSSPSESISPTNYNLDQTGNGWAYWKLGAAINYKYYRLLIVNNDNSDGFVQVGAFFGGNKRTLANNYTWGAVNTKFAITEKQMTDQGGVYGEIKASLYQFQMGWPGGTGTLISQSDKDWLDGMLNAVEDIDSFPILIDETGLSAPKFLWAVFVSRPEFTEVTPDSSGSKWSTRMEVRESG